MATTSQSIARPYSRYGREAVVVLGQHIRINRIEQKRSVQELAERVGISRDMMRRIEQGDPRCGIGLVFEAATVVGVALFEEDRNDLTESVQWRINDIAVSHSHTCMHADPGIVAADDKQTS